MTRHVVRLVGFVLLALAIVIPAAEAQEPPPTVPVQECVPGVTVPTNVPSNGPSPVGRCEPGTRQRIIDTFVWLFLVALLGLLAYLGLRTLVRSVRGEETAPAGKLVL